MLTRPEPAKCAKHPCDRCDTATVFTCCAAECSDCIARAKFDAERRTRVGGDAGKFMRGGEPG